ncbi:PIN domain-containing protein [Brevundimonas sp.]
MVDLALDTSEIVAALRRRPRYDRRCFDLARREGVTIVVPATVVHELIRGASLSSQPAENTALVERYLRDFETIDFTPEDAAASGRLGAELRAAGTPIGDIDTLIAGQALARGWTVVTRNVRHFGRVQGLPLIDWSVGAEPLSAEAIAARVSG